MADPSASEPTTHVIQVTNIAPQATRDQMHALFTSIGFTIEDLRLYPSVRDASVSVSSRAAFVRFAQPEAVGICQHLNNTVFIDRAIIITPVASGVVPDETEGLQMAASAPSGGSGGSGGNTGTRTAAKMPPNVINRLEGLAPNAYIMTYDPRLESSPGMPSYPPLPASTSNDKVEEIRRTVCVLGLDSTVSAQQCMELFAEAGEVKYFRFCTRSNDPVKYALVEFSEHASVIAALCMNDRQLGTSRIKVTHSLQAITKPQAKSNEAAQKEIEEAMSKVKEAQSLVSAAVDPLMGMLGASSSARTSRSRSRSKSRRSRSRGRSSYSRHRSRSRDRRSRRSRTRSRSRDRRRSRSRDRRRSRSRDRRRRRSRSRERRRDRSRDRERRKDEDSSKKEENGGNEEEIDEDVKANGSNNVEKKDDRELSKKSKKRSRSRSRDRRRSRSRERRRRSRSRSRDRRRRSRERKKRSRSKERSKHRSRSRDRKDKKNKSEKRKVARDYDQEEEGYEQMNAGQLKGETPVEKKMKSEENLQAEDMEISNSP